MSSRTFNVTLELVRNEKTVRIDQYTDSSMSALLGQIKRYIHIFKVKPGEYKGGTLMLTGTEGKENKEIGIIHHDGSLQLYEAGTSCIYCQATSDKGFSYDDKGHCSKCTNKVVIQAK